MIYIYVMLLTCRSGIINDVLREHVAFKHDYAGLSVSLSWFLFIYVCTCMVACKCYGGKVCH